MDKRVKKTKDAINAAFITIVTEKKDLSSITVRDIIEESGISRSTFYTHYDGIADLVNENTAIISNDIFQMFIKAHSNAPSVNNYKTFYRLLLEYIYNLGSYAKVIFLIPDSAKIIEQITEEIHIMIYDYYEKTRKAYNSEILKFTAIMWTHGCFSLIKEWVKGDFKYTPDEMSTIMIDSIKAWCNFFTNY